ncbi:pyridoxal phosphate-dependent transferase [Vararia minispora EC-137]|uniref:Pyridoxal phosphate-dependent transferase n=1 Tax=Vararia minispora EC-137 TaxID=1314806 RepID=A0ACB8QHD5_9AGAM|nr:pyridoxal phosphate-dependent transferase [Vararia minispora EC-137]
MHGAIASWFLGPQSENQDRLQEYFSRALQYQTDARASFHPEDGAFITPEIKSTEEYKAHKMKFDVLFDIVAQFLNEFSVPFFSQRYAGHMCFETSMPAITGWLLTVLFNPNNVAFEASPFTTLIEMAVGQDLCHMLGYEGPLPWGHLACDGTVANMESMWAARNLKFYPISLRAAMEPRQPLSFASSALRVHTCAQPDKEVLFSSLTIWDLLNLPVDVILDLPELLEKQCGVTPDFLATALNPFSVQENGKDELMKKYGIIEPVYFASATRHYSWPKAAALTGLGASNCISIPVDDCARLQIDKLRKELQICLDKKQAVYAVVAVIGTTEEGAVDPLEDIISLRQEFQEKGLSFVVHADAAWGGYFASMIRDKDMPPVRNAPADRDKVPQFALRDYTIAQFHALKFTDSITIDPHKSGYVPYPAGGLCYKDGRMRYLLTWTAPYLSSGATSQSIGIYGIEGSKPGAPAVSTFLHNSVVGLDKKGHGALLGEVVWTSSRLSAVWATLADGSPCFTVVPFNDPGRSVLPQDLTIIRERVIGKDNETVYSDEIAREALRNLGSDLNINAFCLNFKLNGKLNDDVEEANYLNKAVYYQLALVDTIVEVKQMEMFISATTFEMHSYGACCTSYKKRIGLETDSKQDLFVLRNVCMSPFQSAGMFVDKLGQIFKGVVEKEIQLVVRRNTIIQKDHVFLVQRASRSQLYLVLLPNFYDANRRSQLILSVGDAKVTGTGQNTDRELMMSFPLLLTRTSLKVETAVLNNIRIVKNRSLLSRYRDLEYPTFTPFYLYGTPEAPYMDHVLTRAANVQITTQTKVSLKLDKVLTAAQLNAGVLAFLREPEHARQPPGERSQHLIRRGQREFFVSIYADPHPATTHGPGLVDIAGHPIATGTVTLAEWPWVWLGLNVGANPPKVNEPDTTPTTIGRLLAVSPPVMEDELKGRGQSYAEKLHPWAQRLRDAGLIRDRSSEYMA